MDPDRIKDILPNQTPYFHGLFLLISYYPLQRKKKKKVKYRKKKQHTYNFGYLLKKKKKQYLYLLSLSASTVRFFRRSFSRLWIQRDSPELRLFDNCLEDSDSFSKCNLSFDKDSSIWIWFPVKKLLISSPHFKIVLDTSWKLKNVEWNFLTIHFKVTMHYLCIIYAIFLFFSFWHNHRCLNYCQRGFFGKI